jgi:hypothetical protein
MFRIKELVIRTPELAEEIRIRASVSILAHPYFDKK